MYFVVLGVLLVLMHLLGIGPPAAWNWNLLGDLWKFVTPFLLAIAWWAWADASGLNKRREMEKMEERKKNRRKENLASLGLDHRARRNRKS
ncbi:MAG: TIGR04438 family Trp-rich protein [Rhizobacter sp.]|nr:TIGR04438 family Trp-rich protein [Rhizobacter sp.]